MKRPSIAKSFSLLTVLTLFEKVIAFVFQAIIASLLGTSAETDAYFSASELFGVFEVAVISTLTVAALNKFIYHLNREGEQGAFVFLSKLLSFYIPIVIILSVGIFTFAVPLSYLTAPGFSKEARETLVLCIRVMSVIPIIECFTAIGMAVLRQKKRFGITGLKSLFISVIGIVFVVAFYKLNMDAAVVLSVAYVISMLLFCVLTMIYVRKYGSLRLVKPKIDSEIKSTVGTVLPLILSYGITRATLMIGKIIASFLENGAVSQLTYAHNLFAVVSAVFVTNLTTILLTDFNELIVVKAYRKVSDKIKSVASVMTIILIPITIVSVVCSEDVVKIVYERGQFTSETTVLVANVLAIYALSFIPTMINGIYNQVFYAVGDTKTPMWIALVNIVVNISVSFIFIEKIGLLSVAIASLFSSLVASVLCRIKVKKYLEDFKGCYTARFIFLCVIATVICTICAIGIKTLEQHSLLSFITTTIVTFFVFGFVLLILREPNLIAVLRKLRRAK